MILKLTYNYYNDLAIILIPLPSGAVYQLIIISINPVP